MCVLLPQKEWLAQPKPVTFQLTCNQSSSGTKKLLEIREWFSVFNDPALSDTLSLPHLAGKTPVRCEQGSWITTLNPLNERLLLWEHCFTSWCFCMLYLAANRPSHFRENGPKCQASLNMQAGVIFFSFARIKVQQFTEVYFTEDQRSEGSVLRYLK